MKTVLIPTDFSDHTRDSIKYALDNFGDELHRIVLLHAYSDEYGGKATLISLQDILKERSERGLAADASFVRTLWAPSTKEVVTVSFGGDLLEGIKQVATREKVDLVVFASDGTVHPPLPAEINPALLLRQIRRPVLFVPVSGVRS